MKRSKMLKLGLPAGFLIILLSLGGCVAPEGAEGGFDWTIIIFLVLIFAMFYFVLIRPQRKRQKEHQQLVEQLKRGDRVVTAGGIFGEIESVSEDSIVIKVESGATLRVARGSVALKQEKTGF
jgi:preprotein translocase subunit YajC